MLNIKPKPKHSFEITKGKIAVSLLIFLAFFSIYKTYTSHKLTNEVYYLRAQITVAELKDMEKTTLDTAFPSREYCGWRVAKPDGGETTSSDNFPKGEVPAAIFSYNTKAGENISVCMASVPAGNGGLERNIVGILFVIGVLYFLMKDGKNESKK